MKFRAAALLIFGLLLFMAPSAPAWASFSATAQPCDLFERNPRQLLASCYGEIDGRSVTVSLHGKRPNAVNRIDFTWDDETAPFQSIEIDVKPFIDPETVAIMLRDADFDGYEDFAVMRTLPPDANVPYAFFIFDKAQKRFMHHEELSAIPNPEIQPARKNLRSYWEDGNGKAGLDWFEWQDGKLVVIRRREENTEADPASCTARIFERRDGKLSLIRSEECEL